MGTNYIAPTWRQPENLNKDRLSNYSINFNGTSVHNEYINFPSTNFLNNEQASFSFWIKPDTYAGVNYGYFFSGSTGDKGGIAYSEGSNSGAYYPGVLYWYSGSSSVILDVVVTENVWNHIVVVFDGTSIKTYKDGSLGSTKTITPPTSLEYNTIGRYTPANNHYVEGCLAQVCVFNYALTDGTNGTVDQINHLYNLINPLIISGAEPIAYWPLGDNSNTTATAGYPNIVSDADSVFQFNSSGNRIDLGLESNLSLGGASKYSTSLWFKKNANVTNCLWGYNYGDSDGSGFYLWQINGQLRVAVGNDSLPPAGFGFYTIAASNIPIGEWTNIIVVFDGTLASGNDRIKVYQNGEPSTGIYTNGSSFPATLPTGLGASDRNVYLGQLQLGNEGFSYNYDGELSNVQQWDTDLSLANANTIYNNGLPLLELSEIPQNNNLLAWYKLNQSAVLTPGVPTNWTITKIGNPNYSQTNDGCYVADNSGSVYYGSGGLLWHDNNSGTTVGSDYFQWNSPTIYTSGSNIVLSSSGGSYRDPWYGSQAILEYNIDDGSWVTWHTQTNGPGGFGIVSFSIPSTGNLTVSNNIKIRIKGVDKGSPDSFLKINDISATGGTSSYNENFLSNTTKYGWYGGAENQPPATSSADHWDIPDNRSAYPQSFKFLASEKVIVDENFFTLTGTNKMQVCTISFWARLTEAGYKAVIGLSTATNWSLRVYQGNMWFVSGGNNYIKWLNVNQGIDLQDGEWHHCLMTIPTADDKDDCDLFLDGLKMSNVVPTFRTNHGAAGGGSGNPMGRLAVGGGYPTDISGVHISNVQVWLNTALSDPEALSVYNNGVPLISNSIQPSSSKAWFNFDKTTSAWDGTNWNFENQIYPANWKSAFYSGADAGMLRDDDSKSAYANQVFSMSVWVKPRTGAATNGDIFACKGSSWQGVMLGYIGNDLQLQIGDKNTTAVNGGGLAINGNWSYYQNRVEDASPDYTPYGEWSHIVVVWNGTDSKFYINGDLVETITPPSSLTIDYGQSPINSSFGGRNDANGSYFDGTISNFAYWSSEIDQTAVTALYNNGAPEASISQSPNHWFTLKAFGDGTVDKIGNLDYNNRYFDSGIQFVDTFVSVKEVTGSNMVEANLIDDNVSTVNGESDTLPGTALVQSDLTRKLPFSNYSINLDGLDYFKAIGTDFEFGNGTTDTSFSISTWVKLDSIGSTWVSCGSTTQRRYRLATRGTGVLTFELYSNNTSSNSLVFDSTSTTLLTTETWYNVIASYDASAVSLKIFVDGQEVVGTLTNNGYTAMGTGSTEMNFGRFFSNGTTYLEGFISNFCFYKQTISDEEALDIYNNGIPSDLNSSFTPGTPYAWFPMDQNYTYFNGTVLVARDNVGALDLEGENVIQSDIVGSAPGSEVNGVGSNLTIADLKGDMQNSTNNSYSINMADYADGVTNPADSGRSTNVP